LGLLIFFSNSFLSNEVVLLWETPVTKFSEVKNYEWAILLTGITKYDVGPKDRVYFNRGADRVVHTVQLYKEHKIKKILVSGGSGRLNAPDEIEGEEVKKALLLMGVPDSVIIVEGASRNTHESALASKKILEEEQNKSKCLLVTSAYHMKRSVMCFEKVGVTVDPFSTDFISYHRKFYFDIIFIPSLEAFLNWQTLFREWTGVIAYKLAGYI
jgi:uncharacterized SAM-binding protein YcdF (DUF218 family)